MQTKFKSHLPALFLAAGVLGASAVSLMGSRSFAWALAGPSLLAGVVIAARMLSNRVLLRTDPYSGAVIIAGAVFVAGVMVAVVDPASVMLLMPLLGGCAASVLVAERCGKATLRA